MNSNKVITHFIQKSIAAAHIRNIAANAGVQDHTDPARAQERFNTITLEREIKIAKSRKRKAMNKAQAVEADILQALDEIEEKMKPAVYSKDMDIDFLFTLFKVTMIVCPPTRSKIDPPNLYPTLKPLIDGLTDASWWKDDTFEQLLEVSFKYGGLSGIKGVFRIILEIEEISDPSEYIVEAEIHARNK